MGECELNIVAELAAGVVHHVELGTDRRVIDEAHALFTERAHRVFDIVNCKGDVMQTFALFMSET